MLVTNPQQRATLPEILAHPWMVKGYDGAPDAHLPLRQPLRPGELDPEVVKGMTGFEFGTSDAIEARLTEILTSEAYVTILHAWEAKHPTSDSVLMGNGEKGASATSIESPSNASLNSNTRNSVRSSTDAKSKTGSKRFSGIDFYRKKLAGNPLAAAFGGKDDQANGSAVNGISAGATWPGAGKEPLDPTRGFHPLISIYYLVSEKMERERLYGHSFFASSNLSVTGPPPPPPPPPAHSQARAEPMMSSSGPTAADIPQEPHTALRVPEVSHASHRGYDPARREGFIAAPPRAMPASLPPSPTPVFDSDARVRSKPLPNMAGPPRARANGEEVEAALREKGLGSPASPAWSAPTPTDAVRQRQDAALPPPLRTSIAAATNHKRSLSLTTRRPSSANPPVQTTEEGVILADGQPVTQRMSLNGRVPSSENRRSVHVMMTPKGEAGTTPAPGSDPRPIAGAESSPPPAFGATLARRFGSLMSRSPSAPLDTDGRDRRRQARMSTGGMSHGGRRGSVHLSSGLSGVEEGQGDEGLVEAQAASGAAAGADEDPFTRPGSAAAHVHRSGTMQEISNSNGRQHQRERSSGTASVGRAAGFQMSPMRRPSTMSSKLDAPGQFPVGSPGEPGGWQGATNPAQASALPSSSRRETVKGTREASSKPVFLKGLFSVQTTSTKSRQVIHADLVRVLDRIGVQYREIKGGYECVHLPSLDFSAVSSAAAGQGNARIPFEQAGAGAESSSAAAAEGGQRPLQPKRKPSRISFVSSKKDKERARREGSTGDSESSIAAPSSAATGQQTAKSGSRSRASSLTTGTAEYENVAMATSPGARPSTPSRAGQGQGQPPRQRTDSLGALSILQTPRSPSLGPAAAVSVPVSSAGVNAGAGAVGAGTGAGVAVQAVHELAVRFEIFVVKVPLLLGVNGLQFRRVAGNPWQYQMLAKRVLQELKVSCGVAWRPAKKKEKDGGKRLDSLDGR